MAVCFVIQPFDGGQFDKRYKDILKPAIEAAGLEPYRVDNDASASIPIEAIQNHIKSANVCLADISRPNPNVWFEVGFAIASGREVVMICSIDVEKFPFDVQHRAIIRYKTEAPSDFVDLSEKITKRLDAAIKKRNELADIADLSPVAATDGLTEHEMVALVTIAEDMQGTIAAFYLQNQMNQAGYTNIAASLAVRGLIKKRMVESKDATDDSGHDYFAYGVTEKGFDWLDANQRRIILKHGVRAEESLDPPAGRTEEEIPF